MKDKNEADLHKSEMAKPVPKMTVWNIPVFIPFQAHNRRPMINTLICLVIPPNPSHVMVVEEPRKQNRSMISSPKFGNPDPTCQL